MLKNIYQWVIKNLWNLFGVLGVAGTFYFSLIHVPDYVKHFTNGKINIAHETLLTDVKELIFYDKEITIENVEIFIKGKELKYSIDYPYTSDELLIYAQDDFMSNKFIPIEKREKILSKISTIRSTYIKSENAQKDKFSWRILLPWLLSGIGIFIGMLGIKSIYKKIISDKETQIDISDISGDIINNSYNSASTMSEAVRYEEMLESLFKELQVLKVSQRNLGRDQSIKGNVDFIIEHNKTEYIVEAKNYRNLLGLGTARKFVHQVHEHNKAGILIVSSGLTKNTKDMIYKHNIGVETEKIHIVIGRERAEIKSQLKKLLS